VVAEGKCIAEHQRQFSRDRRILDPWHYLPLLERKPGALRNGLPFKDWSLPTPIARVRKKLLNHPKGDRAFVDILLAMREYGSEIMTVACELTLEHGTVSSAVVLNHVHRLAHSDKLRSVDVPDSLVLNIEPAADCGRYDRLREATL
jgi:hypothetical protein